VELDLELLRSKFDALSQNRCTREEVARWAEQVMNLNDQRQVIYTLPSDEERIWEAVMFLMGYDLLVSETDYLHSVEDLMDNRP
jgi:uncharacterized protein YfbU (UPF0304 family)